MKIGVVPKIIEKYSKQYEYTIEFKLIEFLKKVFKNSEIYFLTEKKKIKLNLIVLSGGNDIYKVSKLQKDKLRYEIDKYYINQYLGKIPIIGICYGAQILAFKSKNILYRSNLHVGSHLLYFSSFLNKKKINVLSHHKYVFKNLLNFEIFAKADDGSIEGFFERRRRFCGIIWHPERQKNIKLHKKLFIKIYEIINFSLRKRKKIKN